MNDHLGALIMVCIIFVRHIYVSVHISLLCMLMHVFVSQSFDNFILPADLSWAYCP
jgi:hypothetical protein